jgi:hypothetical protein
MKTASAILFLSLLILGTLACDVAMYYGGYYGHLKTVSLGLVKMLFVCLAVIIVIVSFRKRQLIAFFIGMFMCSCLIGYLVYARGDKDPFFLGVKAELSKNMDTTQLQTWAEATLSKYPNDDFFIDGNDLPSFLNVNGWKPSGAGTRNNDGSRCVQICWGSGMAGTYGLLVGNAKFTMNGVIFWKPGIYFYHSS